MTRSPTEESAKVSKRKGARSVSTLTPSQLARKRANDREAQRAIRARTKEHIEKLERELDTLKQATSAKALENLARRNRELQQQIAELTGGRGHMASPFAPPGATSMCLGGAPESPLRALSLADSGFNVDGMPPAGSGVSSRASSFGHGSPEYSTSAGPGFGSTYLPTPEPCDPWPVVVPVSAVSSPCSSTGHPDDYVPGYIPTSVPTSMMPGSVVPGATSVPCIEDNKVEFEELDTSTTDQGYGQPNVAHTPTAYMHHHHHQQQWPMYTSTGYYAQSPTI